MAVQSATQLLVQKLYVAFYQRPADPAGLTYWGQRIEAAGGDATETVNAFANSDESLALYGGVITNDNVGTVIDAVYQALFGVPPDDAGKKFYVDGFKAGTFNAGTLALDILNGAKNDDAIAIANKLQVANSFTQQVDGRALTNATFGQGSNFAATYAGATDADAARELLKLVTSSPATVLDDAAVKTALQNTIANPGDPIVGGPDAVAPVVTAQTGIKTYAENQAAGATLETVAATDNTAVTGYKIVTGNESGFFQISNDGKISLTAAGAVKTAASNDFETTPNDFVLGVQALDAAGNASATSNFSLRVTDLDDRAPVLTGSVVNGTRAILSYDEALNPAKQPAIGDFAVNIAAGGSIAVTSVQVTGNTVVLTLGRAANPGETLNVSYTPGTNVVSDAAGNAVAPVAARALVADTTAPVITAAQAINYAEDIVTGVTATRTTDTVLGKVAATDDTGVTAYNITAGNEAGFFAIDGAGNIRLTAAGLAGAANDFEVAPNSFVLTVTATDGAGNTSAAQQVTLNVTNVTSDDAAPPPVAQVIQMTTGNDNVTPTGTIGVTRTSEANDTIAAFFDGNAQGAAGATTTIGLGDTFDAAGGTADKLVLTLSNGAKAFDNTFSPVLNGLEIVEIRSTGAAPNVADFTGVSPLLNTLNFDAGNQATIVKNVAAQVKTFGMTNITSNAAAIVTVNALAGTLTGATDAATLNLSGNTGGKASVFNLVGGAAGQGYEILNVNSTGGATRLAGVTVQDGAAAANLDTLNVKGSANLRIDGALAFAVDGTADVVNAQDFTGSLRVGLTHAADNLMVTGGSGNDRFDFAGNLGAGAGTLSLNGGTGTDTIAVNANIVAGNAQSLAINAATSFETVELTQAAAAADAAALTTIKNFVFSNDAAAAAVTNVVNANTFSYTGTGAAAAAFTVKADTAADVLNLTVNNDAGFKFAGGVVAAQHETVNLTLTSAGGLIDGNGQAVTANGGGKLVILGAASMVQTANNGLLLGAGSEIDASAATGNLNLSLNAPNTSTLKGGAGNDQLRDLAGQDNTIVGGAGNDTITGGVGADQLTGGTGNDTFIIAAPGDTRNATFAAIDTTTVNIDRITDFVGNGNLAGDTIQVGAVGFGVAAGSPVSVTAFTVANANNFNDLAGALAGIQVSTGTLLSIADVTVSAGSLAGRYVVINDAATPGYQVGDDIIALTGVTGALNVQDFTVV